MPLSTEIPLFPLGVVLYPDERMALHIFEERYKEMIRYCLDQGEPFGIILYNDGRLADVGCTARIQEVMNQYEDGRYDLEVRGEMRFRVRTLHEEKVYLTAEVTPLPESRDRVLQAQRERLITQHMKLLELAGRSLQPTQYQGLERISYFIAHNAGLTLEQKQEVLEMPGENARITYLVRHLEAFIPKIEEAEEVRRKVRSNGHFKDIPPDS
jgi:ATP-dependent Lon protease